MRKKILTISPNDKVLHSVPFSLIDKLDIKRNFITMI